MISEISGQYLREQHMEKRIAHFNSIFQPIIAQPHIQMSVSAHGTGGFASKYFIIPQNVTICTYSILGHELSCDRHAPHYICEFLPNGIREAVYARQYSLIDVFSGGMKFPELWLTGDKSPTFAYSFRSGVQICGTHEVVYNIDQITPYGGQHGLSTRLSTIVKHFSEQYSDRKIISHILTCLSYIVPALIPQFL